MLTAEDLFLVFVLQAMHSTPIRLFLILGVVAATGKVSEFLDQWPEFDKDVLGGNYQGHYGTMKVGIVFSVVPGMENHPLFKGVSPEDFIGPVVQLHTLYENRPLRSPTYRYFFWEQFRISLLNRYYG